MSLPALDLVLHPETPVKRDVRRFRWFRRAFVDQVASVSRASGIGFEVRTERLAEAFVDWSRAFAAQKPVGEADKRAFVDFASGLMLYYLLRSMPVTAAAPDNRAPDAAPVAFWPAGFACLAFCLNVRKAVLTQNFDETSEPAPVIDDLRSWWSFRENVAENGTLAVPFFSLFAGAVPDWESGLQFRAAPVPRPAAVRLRLVQDNPRSQPAAQAVAQPRALLGASVSLVVVDIRAISNSRDLLAEELCAHIRAYGLAMTEAEVRARFLGAPLALAMTHVALQTGQICPGSFIDRFNRRIADRYRAELRPDAPVARVLRELRDSGIALRILVEDQAGRGALVAGCLGLELPADTFVEYAPGSDGLAAVLAAGGCGAESCLVVSDDADSLTAAAELGADTLGIARDPRARARLERSKARAVVDGFEAFPEPSR